MPPSVERRAVVAYIGFGANLGDSISRLHAGRRRLRHEDGVRELAFSRIFRSAPLGPEDQPDYVNAVMAVETSLPPEQLLATLHRVEQAEGRIRTGDRWGPRTLDLDLLLYGNETINSPALRVPHPGIAEREFVLIPLLEIAPDLTLPDGRALHDLLPACPRRESPLVPVEASDG